MTAFRSYNLNIYLYGILFAAKSQPPVMFPSAAADLLLRPI